MEVWKAVVNYSNARCRFGETLKNTEAWAGYICMSVHVDTISPPPSTVSRVVVQQLNEDGNLVRGLANIRTKNPVHQRHEREF